jgi:xanthine dehydrogenase YagR molybdenum-binding subunit
MAKLVSSKVEIEGHVSERFSLWSGAELPTWPADAQLNVVGRQTPRLDAVAKATGRAVYTDDRRFPGMLECKVLRSPYANARIQRIDTSRAAQLPGVHGVICYRTVPCLTLPNGEPIFDRTVGYAGQAVAAVAAENEAIAEEALRLIQVSYDVRDFAVDAVVANQSGAPLVRPCGNRPVANNPERYVRGDLERGRAEAEVVVEAEFRTQIAVQEPLEPHCAVCRWDGDALAVWTSTQYVHGVAKQVANIFQLPRNRVEVICEAVGGGFGGKLMVGKEVIIPALLARSAGRPVRLSFDRAAETIAAGSREPTYQTVRLGARRDGTLTFIEHEALSGIGAYGEHRMEVGGPSRLFYRCPNVATTHTLVWTNLCPPRPFRAPGYVEGAFALESAMDELAHRLGLDPLELRRRNNVSIDQVEGESYTSKPLDEAYSQGAAMLGWDQPKAPPSQPSRRRGRGVATQVWGGGGGPPAYATVQVLSDGTALVTVGSQDIGTGTGTAIAQVAAEELGFRLADIRVVQGDSDTPYGPASGGSMTVASVTPAVRAAAHQAKADLLLVAAHQLGQPAESLVIRNGVVHGGLLGEQTTPVADVLAKLEDFTIIGQGDRAPNPQDLKVSTFGVQFAEVEVDVETGEVVVLRQVAVHDCGRVISPLQAASQVAGGVTQGLGYALTEGLIVDPLTGVPLNPNLEEYLLPTIADVPAVDSRLLDEIDPLANSVGVKGLGEPPIIPAAPAIANAIADAIGVRIRDLPITRAKILEALAQTQAGDTRDRGGRRPRHPEGA